VKGNETGAFIIDVNDKWERVAAAAARMSTQKGNALAMFKNSEDNAANGRSIKKVLSSGHGSIIEHVVFNIAFCNVSALTEQFMIQFRLASFVVKSRRYVDFSDAGFYTPVGMSAGQRAIYENHVKFLFGEYKYFSEAGIPREDARFVLPSCFCSNFYCTVNGRELLLMLRRMMYGYCVRSCEVRSLGEQLLSQLKEVCPVLYDEFYVSRSEFMNGAKQPAMRKKRKTTHAKGAEILMYPKNAAKILDLCAQYRGTVTETPAEIVRSPRPRALEHLVYSFAFHGISLSGITHIVRHRMQSIVVPPLSAADPLRYLIPDKIRHNETLRTRYEAAFAKNAGVIEALRKDSAQPEDLAYLALSGNVMDVMSTMNARELLLFFKLRTCSRAQWEIREFANDLHEKLTALEPNIFSHFGPSCHVTGVCPEGSLSCGRMRYR